MSLKSFTFAALLATPLLFGASQTVFADKHDGKNVDRIEYMEKTIVDLIAVREALLHDMKEAKTEEDALKAADQIGDVDRAIETIHTVEHMHDMYKKQKDDMK